MNIDELYAVLMTVHEDIVLLPNAAVAEVLSRDALKRSDGGPDWLLGHCEWNNRVVPVVRLEALNGGSGSGDPKRERVVVINSLGKHLAGGNVAFVAQGYPHLVTLNRAAMRPLALRDSDRNDLVLGRVRIASQQAFIPNLETVEAEVSRAEIVGQ